VAEPHRGRRHPLQHRHPLHVAGRGRAEGREPRGGGPDRRRAHGDAGGMADGQGLRRQPGGRHRGPLPRGPGRDPAGPGPRRDRGRPPPLVAGGAPMSAVAARVAASRILSLTGSVLLFTGACLSARALYLRGKAVLAKVLIRRAWDETVRTGRATPPWPWADTHP